MNMDDIAGKPVLFKGNYVWGKIPGCFVIWPVKIIDINIVDSMVDVYAHSDDTIYTIPSENLIYYPHLKEKGIGQLKRRKHVFLLDQFLIDCKLLEESHIANPGNDEESSCNKPSNDGEASRIAKRGNDEESPCNNPSNDGKASRITKPGNDEEPSCNKPNNDGEDVCSNTEPGNDSPLDEESSCNKPSNDGEGSRIAKPGNEESSCNKPSNDGEASRITKPGNDEVPPCNKSSNDEASRIAKPGNEESSCNMPSNDGEDVCSNTRPGNEESSCNKPSNDGQEVCSNTGPGNDFPLDEESSCNKPSYDGEASRIAKPGNDEEPSCSKSSNGQAVSSNTGPVNDSPLDEEAFCNSDYDGCEGDEDDCVSSGSEYIPDETSSESETVEDSVDSDGALSDSIPVIGNHLLVTQDNKVAGLSVVVTSNTKIKRRWDKKNFCVFCEKPYSKLPRHFLQKHLQETEVAEFSSLQKKSIKRKILIQKLTNKGNFSHNCEVLKKGSGQLVPSKRPTAAEKRNPRDYSPCDLCLGLFINKKLWKHQKVCKLRKSPTSKVRNRNIQSRSALMLPSDVEHKAVLTKILEDMNNDSVSMCVRNDALILKYGVKLLKVGNEQHNKHYISQKMRELARLALELRKTDPLITIQNVIQPAKFKLVVDAVKRVCGYDVVSQRYKTPSLALKLGSSLKKCCYILKAEALLAQNDTQKCAADQFTELCELEWGDQISSEALKTLQEKKWNKPQLLPMVDDLILLQKFLRKQQETLIGKLQNSVNTADWYELSKILLTKVILFNRRRSGEASRVLIESYQKLQNTTHDNEDVGKSLSKFERELCKQLHRFETKGKRGRKVPVLLTEDMKMGIDFMLKCRTQVEVSPENLYLFAIPNSVNALRGSDCIRRFSIESGTKRPDMITSTKLRKHVATFSQMLSLRDNELDILAKFMGHDIRVHREYYRLPENTLQVAKISKILLAMETGNITKMAGMNLDDIAVDVTTTIDDESDSDSDCDTTLHCDQPVEDKIDATNKEQSSDEEGVNLNGGSKKGTCKPIRRYWTADEKRAVSDELGNYIQQMKVPGKLDCDQCLRKRTELSRRSWRDIKNYIHNVIQSKKKNMKHF